MHPTIPRLEHWLRFFHLTATPQATAAQLREALWDLVASVHFNADAARDESIRLVCAEAVRLLERGRAPGQL